MAKIQMKNAIAELDGDEMTRVLWKVIKDELLLPFVDLKTEYFDLGLKVVMIQMTKLHMPLQKQSSAFMSE